MTSEYLIDMSSDTGEGGTTSKIDGGYYYRRNKTENYGPDPIRIHYEPYDGNHLKINIEEKGNFGYNEVERDLILTDSVTKKSIICRYREGAIVGDCKVVGNLNLIEEKKEEADLVE